MVLAATYSAGPRLTALPDPFGTVRVQSAYVVSEQWPPGTPKLTIINKLLNAINYETLYFDEYGVAIVRPYVPPASRESEFDYATDQNSVILPDAEQTLDLFDVPNSFTLVVSDPDRPPLTST
ncbi:hypothetical protein [Streptomyces gardneri]|uniref:hypothetical protein n=1 Tax=Streptomyces gardneri TaxID=66892 RepID=UPI0033BFCB2D